MTYSFITQQWDADLLPTKDSPMYLANTLFSICTHKNAPGSMKTVLTGLLWLPVSSLRILPVRLVRAAAVASAALAGLRHPPRRGCVRVLQEGWRC